MSTSTAALTSPTGPRPLQLLDSNLPSVSNSPVSPSALPSPRSSALGLSTPPPSARPFKRGNLRRQSTISYFPSDYVRSPSIRSPTASVSAVSRPSSRRSASVGVWEGEGSRAISTTKRDRKSMGALSGNKESLSVSPIVDRGPLTLTEKHADLLQFIAQKEAKCLELRSQLEMHEAELSQLKRKWERIVSRGMDRAYANPLSAASPLPTSTVSSIIPTARDALKEGARILAAGLNDLSTPDQAFQPPLNSYMVSPTVAPVSGFAALSRVSMASSAAKQKAAPRHEATQSMSSVSTATSSTRASTTQSSQRLSQSSASSLSLEDSTEESSFVDALFEDSTISLASSPMQSNRSEKLLKRRSQDASQSLTRSPLSPSPLSIDAKKKSEDPSVPRGKVKARPTSMAMGNSPLPTPVSAWMGSVGSSVGRKWEDLQKNDAFTKSQKRASVLLSDVSQSLFAALASPAPSPSIKSASPLSAAPTASPSLSLLDDEPEQLYGQTLTLGAPLIPSVVSSSPSPTPLKVDDDDDEWNW